MEKAELEKFYLKHCKFKLRSGKEVFGVIWKENHLTAETYFTSFGDLLRYKHLIGAHVSDLYHKFGQPINSKDIIYAEKIEEFHEELVPIGVNS